MTALTAGSNSCPSPAGCGSLSRPCVQELQPQLERHMQAAQVLGAAMKAAMAEHASTADMRALEAANAALSEAR